MLTNKHRLFLVPSRPLSDIGLHRITYIYLLISIIAQLRNFWASKNSVHVLYLLKNIGELLPITTPACDRRTIVFSFQGWDSMAIEPRRSLPQSGEHMSLKEYFRLDRIAPEAKYEYMNGVIRLMAGGSQEHEDIAFNVRVALKQQFASGPCSG